MSVEVVANGTTGPQISSEMYWLRLFGPLGTALWPGNGIGEAHGAETEANPLVMAAMILGKVKGPDRVLAS